MAAVWLVDEIEQLVFARPDRPVEPDPEPAEHHRGTIGQHLEPDTGAVIVERGNPAGCDLHAMRVELVLVFLAGDIRVVDDEASPAAAGNHRHGDVDADDDGEERHRDGQHVLAGERTRRGDGRSWGHFGCSGASNLATVEAPTAPSGVVIRMVNDWLFCVTSSAGTRM